MLTGDSLEKKKQKQKKKRRIKVLGIIKTGSELYNILRNYQRKLEFALKQNNDTIEGSRFFSLPAEPHYSSTNNLVISVLHNHILVDWISLPSAKKNLVKPFNIYKNLWY